MLRTIIISMLIAASLVFAAEIFGPVSYYRASGAPDEYDTSFVAYDTAVPCTLIVINGDEAGEHRLSAASVYFNGVEIIKEKDFKPTVGEIIRVVTLESTNNLHFRLRSKPGDFLTVSVRRPCDAVVSLSVDTVIADSACFAADASGWGELTYCWDFDGDGTDDTTTTDPTICHIYEESDTYLVKVRVEDKVGCEEEDSEEVVVEVSKYTFRVLFDEVKLEETGISVSSFGHHENGEPLILGTMSYWNRTDLIGSLYYVIVDTNYNIDTLGKEIQHGGRLQSGIPIEPYTMKQDNNAFLANNHIIKQFFSFCGFDTFITGNPLEDVDTTYDSTFTCDSIIITPVFYDYPNWKIEIDREYDYPYVGSHGWTVNTVPPAESLMLYPEDELAILKDGKICGRLNHIYRHVSTQISGSKVAVIKGGYDTIWVYDSTASLLYTLNSGFTNSITHFTLLEDGSSVFLWSDNGVSWSLRRFRNDMNYSFNIPVPLVNNECIYIGNNHILLVINKHKNPEKADLFYFDITDSLTLIWEKTLEGRILIAGDILDNTDVCAVTLGPKGNEAWRIEILSGKNGELVSSYPEDTEHVFRGLNVKVNTDLIYIDGYKIDGEEFEKIIQVERKGGEEDED